MKYGEGFMEEELSLDEVYNQTLENHLAYDQRHGYGSHVLTKDIYDGIWNKVVYLASLIATELLKPDEERLQWLWFVYSVNGAMRGRANNHLAGLTWTRL